MGSLWRRYCLWTTVIRSHRTCRFKGHITIQQRYRSLVKHVKPEGFRTHNGVFVKPGDTVELEDGNFLRVKEVLHNVFYDRYWIVGWKFVRNTRTSGLPGQDPNEVYWVVHLIRNDPRPAAEQALVKVDATKILRQRTMNMVNETYPSHEKRTKAGLGAPNDGVLFCRWKHVIVTRTEKFERPLDAFRIPAIKIAEASFQRLRAEDFDDGHNNRSVDEKLLRHRLGGKKKAGANIVNKEPDSLSSSFEALSLNDNSRRKRAAAAYTFADVCCGAGGASRGAEMAGLELRWALDHDADACETYRLNFPHVRLYQRPLQDLINMRHEDLKVDILHISPPCQAFSQANTFPNRVKDAENIAASMEIGTCLDVARPRIATLEQTSGLMSNGHAGGRHGQHFGNVIAQFTSRNYSIGWKNADLAEWGLAQPRKRLLMIASCPSEPLPPFPPPTHHTRPSTSTSSNAPSTLLPPATIASSLSPLTLTPAKNHPLPPPLKRPRKPYSADLPLPHTILTNRSTNAHPSGLRTFSLKELACLQGFPLSHVFAGRRVMEQVGNAFPAGVAGWLFRWVGGGWRERGGTMKRGGKGRGKGKADE